MWLQSCCLASWTENWHKVHFYCHIIEADCCLNSNHLFASINFFPFLQLESISEDTTIADRKQILLSNFLPVLRSGDWSDIGGRVDMEDTHICIADLAKNFGLNILGEDAISFYGVSSLTSLTIIYVTLWLFCILLGWIKLSVKFSLALTLWT